MVGLQIAFSCQLLRLRRGIFPHVNFAELAEALCQVWGFMHRLNSIAQSTLHPDILSDNIHDARFHGLPEFAHLGMTSPYSGDCVDNIDHIAFRKAMLARDMSVWEGCTFCQAMRLFAVVCTAGQNQYRALS